MESERAIHHSARNSRGTTLHASSRSFGSLPKRSGWSHVTRCAWALRWLTRSMHHGPCTPDPCFLLQGMPYRLSPHRMHGPRIPLAIPLSRVAAGGSLQHSRRRRGSRRRALGCACPLCCAFSALHSAGSRGRPFDLGLPKILPHFMPAPAAFMHCSGGTALPRRCRLAVPVPAGMSPAGTDRAGVMLRCCAVPAPSVWSATRSVCASCPQPCCLLHPP